MSGLKGDLSSLKNFTAKLQELPRVLAQKVAAAAAPALTEAARATFDAGEDAFGVNWTPGSEGQRVTLRKSGDLASYIKYVATGTKLRIALGVRYAKYQIGRRPIFPKQGDPLPAAYQRVLEKVAIDTIRAELGRPS